MQHHFCFDISCRRMKLRGFERSSDIYSSKLRELVDQYDNTKSTAAHVWETYRGCLVLSHNPPQLTLDKCGNPQKVWLKNWESYFDMLRKSCHIFLLYNIWSPKESCLSLVANQTLVNLMPSYSFHSRITYIHVHTWRYEWIYIILVIYLSPRSSPHFWLASDTCCIR